MEQTIEELIADVSKLIILDEYTIRALRGMFKLTLNKAQIGSNNQQPILLSSDEKECDCGKIISLFNEIFGGKLPKCNKLTDARKKLIKARFKEYGYEGIRQVFDNIQKSDFILNNWKPNIEDIFNVNKFSKIYDGGYGSRANTNSTTQKRNGISEDHKRGVLEKMFS